MNVLHFVFESPAVHRVGVALVHSLWQGAAIAAALAFVNFAIRRSAAARYGASCAALLLMVGAPVCTYLIANPVARTDAIASAPHSASAASPTPPAPNEKTAVALKPSSQEPRTLTTFGGTPQPTIPATTPAATNTPEQDVFPLALPWVVLTWMVGVVALAIWNLGGWLAIHQLKSLTTRPVDSKIEQGAARLAARLNIRRRVRILQSAIARTPLVIGALRPIILLPASVLTELSLAELESILAHELAHVRRHDYLVNLVQSAIETILFYHPAVWWVSRQVRIERENCCDDLALRVTRDPATYATALAAVASVRVPSLAPASSGGNLSSRLRRVLGMPDADAGGSRWISGAAVIAASFIALLVWALPPTASALTDDPDVVTIHGRVVDPAGKPAAGARVMTVAYSVHSPMSETKTAADGRFALSIHKSNFAQTFESWEGTIVAATSPGCGPGWARVDHVDAAGDMVLTLAPDDIPIEGRILNLEGQPVDGATVYVTGIRPKAVDLKKLNIDRSDPDQEPGDFAPYLYPRGLDPAFVAKTGPDGRFRFTGLGRDRTIEMIAQGPGIANSYIEAVTRHVETQTKDFQMYLKVTETTHGASFDFTAAPGRSVNGTVRDAVTREPLAGVIVKTGFVMMETVTDAQGHYQLDGFRKENYIQITAMPTEQQPYLMRDADVPLMTGFGPITIDFDLHRGVVFTGKVTDTAGTPVGSMDVGYFPYLSNKLARSLPEFAKGRVPGRYGPVRTKADGTYRIVGLPGPAILAVRGGKTPFRHGTGADQIKCPRIRSSFQAYESPSPTSHNALKEVDVPDGTGQTNLDFQCDPGITVHLHLTDPDGKALTGVYLNGHVPGAAERLKTADVDAVALAPDEERTIFFFQKARNLGKILTLKPADVPDRNLVVKLEPNSAITGRLIGKDGQPLTAASVQGFIFNLPAVGTDENGRFTLTIIPGKPYSIRGIKGTYEFITDAKNISLPSGTKRDLGDIHVNYP
jgi:beta-lactamase regulating signal transducer with metallopeptidase domain